jgi:hypothetical protein
LKGRSDGAYAGALVALKVAAMLWALHCGFAQVSDDDYARTVIAQAFAHAPRLDPSGTSWLPLPFWLYGGAMMVVGRSLGAARGIAFVLGAASPVVAYAGLRSMHSTRIAAAAALTPWSVWLGLAPVPEAWAGVCAAAALFFLAAGTRRDAVVAGALALVAALSRYEAWPVAALVGVVCAARAARAERSARAGLAAGALVAAAGPAFWLANNALAHGDALHFITRVTTFHRAHAGQVPLAARLLEYPRALCGDAPEIVAAGALGAVAAARSPAMRARWVLPMAGAALVFAFLVWGEVTGGAPTHHAARALMPVIGVLAGFGAAGLDALPPKRPWRAAAAVVAAAWLAFVVVRARDVPGNDDASRRGAQIARGRALAKTASSFEVTPCAFEHFALIAAFGAPERVTIEPATHAPVTPDCPRVTAR